MMRVLQYVFAVQLVAKNNGDDGHKGPYLFTLLGPHPKEMTYSGSIDVIMEVGTYVYNWYIYNFVHYKTGIVDADFAISPTKKRERPKHRATVCCAPNAHVIQTPVNMCIFHPHNRKLPPHPLYIILGLLAHVRARAAGPVVYDMEL